MVGTVEQTYEPTTIEEKLDRKNEMKARGTLLMALPNKDELKFHSYQDAKLLMEAIQKRYGGNKESKKVQRILLKQQYENFAASSSETLDQTFDRLQKLITQLEIQGEVIKAKIETISLDDLYNNLKIYEPELTGSSSTSQNPQNVAFVSFNSTNSISSTNEADNTAYGVSTAHIQENYIPPKPDLMFIDEQVESKYVDVVSTISSSAIKTVESKVVSIDVKIQGNPQQKEYKEKGVINSGCSRHMTGSKCYLTEYEDYDDGFVSFGDGKGIISGNGKIKTGTLDFDDVYFCKELKYNLFSVSQMCDKKNKVLFTDTECLVLSSNFKLLDESQVLLRVPRKDNIYSVDLKSVVPTGGFRTNGIAETKDTIVAGPKDSAVDTRKKASEVDASQVSDNGGHDTRNLSTAKQKLMQLDSAAERRLMLLSS
nr:ribonuclease H-like domain-containing protein [Tanacetum cinerariifolium]